jgi:cation-transporting ATPase E
MRLQFSLFQQEHQVAAHPPGSPGLTSADVQARVARGETNAYKPKVGRSYWDIVRDNVLNLFNIVLFTLLVVVLLQGDYATVFFAGFSVVSNSLLGMFQEIAAKRKLDQLAAMQVKAVKAWRNGEIVDLPVDDIVKDDVIIIEPGDRIVVDGRVIHADSFEVDEAQLTGESDAVMKDVDSEVHSGSFGVAGTGVIVATQVGKDSTINKLARLAKTYKSVQTPTQQRISTLVQVSVVVMAVFLPMIFVQGYLNGLPPLEMFRNAVVFVTSLVPQGLVLTAILSLTLGALSISRFQTLVQRVNAVESMANVTVLSFDKTGTLTRNQLAVQEILPLNGDSLDAIQSKLDVYVHNLSHMNRTAAAIAEYTEASLNGRSASTVTKQSEVPFTSARKWGAIVLPDTTLVMGAPERVLNPADTAAVEQSTSYAAQGIRVLALAEQPTAPANNTLAAERKSVALILLSDQVREDIQETLGMFTEQGVALKVISGDNLETVEAIARQAGMPVEHTFTGDMLEHMSDSELETAAMEGSVFARIEPDTKRKLIAALKRRGAYTAMVGDGVNDVPALKEADLAIVMNDGAQIAKDVGDIVLLNNAMSTLPLAFREGKLITQTIFGTSKLFLVKNLYSVLFFVFAGFMAMPFPINPIQISWVTFGVINIPATLIAFRIMKPAPMKEFRRDVLNYVVNGGAVGAASLALLYGVIFLTSAFNTTAARSAVTMYLVLYGVLVLWHTEGIELLRPRSIGGHKKIFVLGLLLGAITIIVPYLLPYVIPSLAATFVFSPPSDLHWLLIVGIFALAVIVLEIAQRTQAFTKRLWDLSKP